MKGQKPKDRNHQDIEKSVYNKPVIFGAIVLVKKGIVKYNDKIAANIDIPEVQNISLLKTTYIIQGLLLIK